MQGLTGLLCAVIVVGIYPAMVFMVAITGPHNETEKRELMDRKRSRTQGNPNG